MAALVTTTVPNITPANLFKYYLDNFFKFPREIKNDIIYCQRALKAHIKVHQMVLDIFQQQEGADPDQMKRILDELETEIYEINAEQHFLFLRLRRIIDEFYKLIKRNGVSTDMNATNHIISREVVPLITDETYKVTPVTVLFRNTEQKLIEKYFEVQQDRNVYEILDSDDDSVMTVSDISENQRLAATNNASKTNNALNNDEINDAAINALSNENDCDYVASTVKLPNGSSALNQMSLLKPMAQRMVGTSNAGSYTDPSQFLQINLDDEKQVNNHQHDQLYPYNITRKRSQTEQIKLPIAEVAVVEKKESIDLPVSKNVKMSRLNLRQALKKARTENMAAKAAANILARAPNTLPAVTTTKQEAIKKAISLLPPPSPVPVPVPVSMHVSVPTEAVAVARATTVNKKSDIKTRARSNATVAAAAAPALPTANSSSEDSNPERLPSPPARSLMWPLELPEMRTLPGQQGKEMFLSLLRLFTPEMKAQMQQRRSKRRRRNVHNNERADFHYGRLEYASLPPHVAEKKKRKTFLLSPQVKRGLQVKAKKGGCADANTPPSRSGSSSPDEKRACNECLKPGGGYLDKCTECKGHYHQACHPEGSDDDKPTTTKKALAQVQEKQTLCPACKRVKVDLWKKVPEETKQLKTLHCTAQDLQLKLAKEKDRKANLQQKSKLYKIQLNNLLNLVNTIKSDQENDSSE